MASQFTLFTQKKFTAMFFTQFLGAFNDNVFKQSLILLLTYTAAAKLGVATSLLNNLAAMLFILPYFLFSALAGQVADSFEKSALTKKIKALEIVIMIIAMIGFVFEWYWLLFLALFLMGTHSTFFGPIKYAYLPEMMDKNELISANGLFQMATSLAILTGMMMAGLLTQLSNHLYWISGVCLVIAVLGYIAASFIPKTIMPTQNVPLNFNIFKASGNIIGYAYRLPLLFFVILGNSWFWFYGATFLTQTPEFSQKILHGNQTVVILLLSLFSVGVAIGSLLCKVFTKNKVGLSLLPFGIIGLSVFAVDLYFSLSQFDHIPSDGYLTVTLLLAKSGAIRIFADLFLIGFFGGLYIVPLYAMMQAYAPIDHRARIIGANNIFNALFMVLSAVFAIILLSVFQLTIGDLFLMTGVINAVFGLFLYKKLQRYKNTMTLIADN